MRNLFVAAFAALLPTLPLAAAPADVGTLKAYAAQSLSKCPDQKLTIERVDKESPIGFIPYLVPQTSSDSTSGGPTTLLYSLPTRQTADAAAEDAHRFPPHPEHGPPRQPEGEGTDHRALRLRVPDLPPRTHGDRAAHREAPSQGRLHPPRPPALRAPRVGHPRGH